MCKYVELLFSDLHKEKAYSLNITSIFKGFATFIYIILFCTRILENLRNCRTSTDNKYVYIYERSLMEISILVKWLG